MKKDNSLETDYNKYLKPIVFFSFTLFFVSLTQTTFIINRTVNTSWLSTLVLLKGSDIFFQVGILLLSNFLVFLSWIWCYKGSILYAVVSGFIAGLLSFSFLHLDTLILNQSGKVISYGLGYWLWVSSSFATPIAIVILVGIKIITQPASKFKNITGDYTVIRDKGIPGFQTIGHYSKTELKVTIIIPGYVFAIGNNVDLIIAKQHPVSKTKTSDNINTTITNYFIIDIHKHREEKNEYLYGPLSAGQFEAKRRELNIADMPFHMVFSEKTYLK